jgi:1,2-diacylglycerol-3-alpha-glucose alpha-1,2-galactosyltransferase
MVDRLRISVVSESEFTVQGHGVHTAYKELTAALQGRDDCEVVVNRSGKADITHLHTVGLYALRRLLFDRSQKVVSAHIVPASLVGSLAGASLWLPLARLYLRWFYNRADLLFAVSDETRRELLRLGVETPIEIVYNLIDTSRYATTAADKTRAKKALGISDDARIVVGAGQVQPRKRVDDFVAAARLLPDVRFIWVGGMPFGKLAADHGAMKALIDSAPENFTCTGVIEHDRVKAYYQAADVFWLPSEQETFGLVVVEAAAAGLPVLLRDIPDYDETFRGAAVMVTDVQSAADAIERLIHNDGVYRDMARLAREKIAVRFDSHRGADVVVGHYRRLLDDTTHE